MKRHRLNTLEIVTDSLDKGLKTWSTQAVELQLLRADRENQKAQGTGFFKMAEEPISTVREDIARDLDDMDMAACHCEEVSRLV